MKIKIEATTVYEGEDPYVVIQTVDEPSPAGLVAGFPGDLDHEEWAMEYLMQYTGTGRTEGDAGYFVKVLECDDRPDLVGLEVEAFG
jgi:hypothetical protein